MLNLHTKDKVTFKVERNVITLEKAEKQPSVMELFDKLKKQSISTEDALTKAKQHKLNYYNKKHAK